MTQLMTVGDGLKINWRVMRFVLVLFAWLGAFWWSQDVELSPTLEHVLAVMMLVWGVVMVVWSLRIAVLENREKAVGDQA